MNDTCVKVFSVYLEYTYTHISINTITLHVSHYDERFMLSFITETIIVKIFLATYLSCFFSDSHKIRRTFRLLLWLLLKISRTLSIYMSMNVRLTDFLFALLIVIVFCFMAIYCFYSFTFVSFLFDINFYFAWINIASICTYIVSEWLLWWTEIWGHFMSW